MKINIDTLGTFYEMAREGAGLAAKRLTQMTSIDTHIGVTRVDITTLQRIKSEIKSDPRDTILVVELGDGLTGTVLMVFDRSQARSLSEKLIEDLPGDRGSEPDEHISDSAILEFCQVMNNGFIDGWANVIRKEINTTPPKSIPVTDIDTYIEGPSRDELDHTFVFRNTIQASGKDTEFELDHYFIPSEQTTNDLFTGEQSEGIKYEKLSGFDAMAEHGATEATRSLSKMTNIDMQVDIRRVNFTSLDAIPGGVPKEQQVSVAFSFAGMPSGYLLFLYDEESVQQLVESTVGASDMDDFARDAVKELSNVMASGLLDGWANILETTIDHSAPAYSHDMGAAVVDPLVIGLSSDQEFAFVFDTQITAVDHLINLDIYIIPDAKSLERALDRLDTSRVHEDIAKPDLSLSDVEEGKEPAAEIMEDLEHEQAPEELGLEDDDDEEDDEDELDFGSEFVWGEAINEGKTDE